MKLLFYGETGANCGPGNANRNLINSLPSGFLTVKCQGRWRGLAEATWKLLRCRGVVVSGVSPRGCVLFAMAKLLGKKRVYLMHGCAAFESRINRLPLPEQELARERYLLDSADLVLTVSRSYLGWFREEYPQYSRKLDYLTMGFDGAEPTNPVSRAEKTPGSIVAAGGDKILKNNRVLAQTVASMEGSAFLTICGTVHGESPEESPNVRWVGKLSRETFLKELEKSELFVLNSLRESFSLAAAEALLRGCSVLLTENAGITDLLELEECDLIHAPMDGAEISSKIKYLLHHPNNGRILAGLDRSRWTYSAMAERLYRLCTEENTDGK